MSTITAAKKSATATEPREALKRAIDRRTEAEGALKDSQAALDRATAAQTETQYQLEAFAELDARLAKQKADAFRRTKPGPADTLATEKQRRDQLIRQASEIEAAIRVLEQECAKAAKVLAEAAQSASAVAWSVIVDEAAGGLAEELMQKKRRVWELEGIGASLWQKVAILTNDRSNLALGAAMVPLNSAVAAQPDVVVVGSELDPIKRGTDKLLALHAALVKSADAPVDWS